MAHHPIHPMDIGQEPNFIECNGFGFAGLLNANLGNKSIFNSYRKIWGPETNPWLKNLDSDFCNDRVL
jgi:hypothetical protein